MLQWRHLCQVHAPGDIVKSIKLKMQLYKPIMLYSFYYFRGGQLGRLLSICCLPEEGVQCGGLRESFNLGFKGKKKQLHCISIH